MPQNDFIIANQTAPSFRSDLNDALQALASLSSGSTAPSTTYANMLWYDTGNNILKMRSEADDAWIDIGTLNQSTNTFQANYTPPFTAVQQGGGASQGTNKVYIGWDGAGGGLRAQVDSFDLGILALRSQVPAAYTDAQARSAQAGHGAGGVGSYAFLGLSVGFAGATITINPGTTHSGANLRWAGTNGITSIVGYGQWLAMGYMQVPAESSGATLFLRTS